MALPENQLTKNQQPNGQAKNTQSYQKNLLDHKVFKHVITSKYYPTIFQIPAILVFGLIMYLLLFGPTEIDKNFGSALTWILWWPLIPFFFLLVGRFWCAICPFATISDFVQKFFCFKKPIPRWLKKYGIWIIDILFIFAVWVDHIYGIVENPRGSGYFLLTIFIGVLLSGILFERRAWCRYLCTIGGLSGNYSRTGMLELRATSENCAKCDAKACFVGSKTAPGCPVFEFPRIMDNSANCNLCGNCIKSCPNDSLRLTLRPPTKELWNIRRPKLSESFLAAIIMGIVFIQNITMLEIWEPILKGLENFLGTTNYTITFTTAYVLAMIVPLSLLALFSWFVSVKTKEKLMDTFTLFGYAIIPLDLAGHLAHNLLHLFNEGGSLMTTFDIFMGNNPMVMNMAILPMDVIKILQYGFILLGIFGSWVCIRKIIQAKYPLKNNLWQVKFPLYTLLIILGVMNFVLFYLPMMDRMHG